MRIDIRPFEGALPITFGMTREQVIRLLGPPKSNHRSWDDGGTADRYSKVACNLGFDLADLVKTIVIVPEAECLAINGRLIWERADGTDPNPAFLALDPNPVDYVGF